MPPGWLYPMTSMANLGFVVDKWKLLHGQPYLPGHRFWGSNYHTPALDEKWLCWHIWSQLDAVWMRAIDVLFVTLAVVSPVIVYRYGSVQKLSTAALLHAIGTAFIWFALLSMLHNLRFVVRRRVAFLRAVARAIGVDEKKLRRAGSRADVTQLILARFSNEDAWKTTKSWLRTQEIHHRELRCIRLVQQRFRMLRARRQQRQPLSILVRGSERRDDHRELDSSGLLMNRGAIEKVKLFQKAVEKSPFPDADSVYQALAGFAVRKAYRRNDVIVLQGRPANDFHILVSGSASCHKDGKLTVTLHWCAIIRFTAAPKRQCFYNALHLCGCLQR